MKHTMLLTFGFLAASSCGPMMGSEDFSNMPLAGVDFADSSFENANFFGIETDLIRADFTGAWLKQANFRYAKAERAQFVRAGLSGAIFDCTNLKYADFTQAVMRGASFMYAWLDGAMFNDTDITKIYGLRRASVTGTQFINVRMTVKQRDWLLAHGATVIDPILEVSVTDDQEEEIYTYTESLRVKYKNKTDLFLDLHAQKGDLRAREELLRRHDERMTKRVADLVVASTVAVNVIDERPVEPEFATESVVVTGVSFDEDFLPKDFEACFWDEGAVTFA